MKRYICALTIVSILIISGLHKLGVTFFKYDGKEEGDFIAIIETSPQEKQYTDSYEATIDGKRFIIYIKKSNKKLKIGDKIQFTGTYNKPTEARNYGGFDYNLYLKTKKIYGTFKVEKYEILSYNSQDIKTMWKTFIENIRENIKQTLKQNLTEENSALLIGLLIGDKSNIDSEVIDNFRDASLSHILAISGAHFSYIIFLLTFFSKKLKRKRLGQVISIITIIFFINLTGSTPSVMRAGIMSIMLIIASMLYRKNDFWTSLSLSMLIQIANNPYVIFDMGLILSYSGVIGIVTFYKIIQSKVKLKMLSVTLSANIVIIPIMMYNFNTISFSFILSNFIASILLGPIIILGFTSTIFKFNIIYIILNILLKTLIKTTELCSNLPISKIYVATPTLISLMFFYIMLFYIYKKNKKKLRIKKKVIAILMIFIILSNLNISMITATIRGELLINFIDVGQGDSCLIRIAEKTLMVDSGGTTDKNSNYDIGKSLLLPYILDRKINMLDYIMISHFDADHSQGFMYVLKNLKVKNAIICKQAKDSNLYQEFIRITKEKNINVIYVQNGDLISIGKDLSKIQLKILHPQKDLISNNPLNNNAIVFKLIYNNFTMLFTGDIEKEAEEIILRKNLDIQANILKVGHHGSKTSTTQEFLDKVNPKIALIGCGVNNKFGHPNEATLEKLNSKKIQVYRTDLYGEISIRVSNKGEIKISKLIK